MVGVARPVAVATSQTLLCDCSFDSEKPPLAEIPCEMKYTTAIYRTIHGVENMNTFALRAVDAPNCNRHRHW